MAPLRLPIPVLDSGMGFRSIRQGLAAMLLASFLALFGFAPAVDAMSCGPEAAPSAAFLIVDNHSGHSDTDRDMDHGVCADGHCHHGGVATPALTETPSAQTLTRTPAVMRPVERLVSRAPAGPERPPRV